MFRSSFLLITISENLFIVFFSDKTLVKWSSAATGVGDLEVTPVSAAIARHLGIDLSQEGRAARSRRGIVFVIHGAPMSG
jgi:hypothetical protein